MPDSETRPYTVGENDGFHAVLDAAGEVVCTCGDAMNAHQYAVLLNQAYERGYKTGYRKAKA